MLDVLSLSCEKNGKLILDTVTAHVKRGRITALLGKNGSGKTTLLRCLCREISYGGCVRIAGRDTAEMTPRERALALSYLPQLLPTPHLTVRELVGLGRSPYLSLLARPSESDRAAVLSAMHRTEIASLAERDLLSLSGGERQRAFLAMMLAQGTPLLLLDEPTSYLDATARRALLSLLASLVNTEEKTILTVLHDVNDAVRLADDILLLDNGRLAFQGSKEDFLAAGLPERHFGLTRVGNDGGLPFFY